VEEHEREAAEDLAAGYDVPESGLRDASPRGGSKNTANRRGKPSAGSSSGHGSEHGESN